MAGLDQELMHFLEVDLPILATSEKTYFDRLAGPNPDIVIHGFGKLGKKIAAGLERVGQPATVFSDANQSYWGTRQGNLMVVSPEEAARKFGQSHVFVVTVWRNYPKVREALLQAGARHVEHFLPLLWKHSRELLPNYNLHLPSRMRESRERIERAFGLLKDTVSQREFLFQLRWMTSLHATDVPPCLELKDQYFPNDLFHLGKHEVFVDCGAYDGDTVKAFLECTRSEFAGIIAIEPDSANVKALETAVASLPPHLQPKIQIKPFGVGSKDEAVAFAATGSESSAIDRQGEATVEVKRLDYLLTETAPTYLKMDIEGAELDALNGAEATIRKHSPKLAVCLYHVQEHLWEIPLKIYELQPSYRVFIRRHRDEFGDVVCYALP